MLTSGRIFRITHIHNYNVGEAVVELYIRSVDELLRGQHIVASTDYFCPGNLQT